MADVIKEFVENISKISGFIGLSIVEIKSGIAYSKRIGKKEYDIETASNFALEMVRDQLNSINLMKQEQIIEEIVITLTSQIHIIDVSKNNEYFIFLVVDSSIANLTVTKALLQKFKKESFQSQSS